MPALSLVDNLSFHLRSAIVTLRRAQLNRDTSAVLSEYSEGWDQYHKFLAASKTLDDWLRISGVEDVSAYYNVNGKVSFEAFDSAGYYRRKLFDAVRRYFPQAKSIVEFGCGVGRNLLYIKREEPSLDCYGYELCQPGVEVARLAVKKFGVDVKYAQLNYVRDPREKYVFPQCDVAFTMFSLEQLPRNNRQAVKNILDHVRLGSIHMEPVPENYPASFRGILGRIEHRKVDYLAGFDAAVRSFELQSIALEKVDSAHHPLMFPSLYVLKKS